KQRIEGLKGVHVYLSKYSPRPLGQITEESRRKLPPPGIHPLVQTHPENGRKALFLNPVRMESIIGMEDEDALTLIEELMRHATQKKYEYRHKWRPGDWVLWDNRSVMHQANPDYDMRERRYLYRLMLKGEAPLGLRPISLRFDRRSCRLRRMCSRRAIDKNFSSECNRSAASGWRGMRIPCSIPYTSLTACN